MTDDTTAELERQLTALTGLYISDEASADRALGAVLAFVMGTNAAIGPDVPMNGDTLKRLREWLEKALEVLMTVARKLSEHGQASVTVGVTGVILSASVTVGVTAS